MEPIEDDILTPDGTETPAGELTPETPDENPAPQLTAEEAEALRAEVAASNAAKEVAEEKFRASSREANILLAKNKTLESKHINNQPTDDDLRQSFPTWDYMTDTEKDLARGTFLARQEAAEAVADKRQREEEATWNREVDTFTLSEQRLAGREEEFKKFANKPNHRGVSLDLLKSAFFHESDDEPRPAAAPGLERASGGTREPAPKKWTAQAVQDLQKNNPKEFARLLQSGEIKVEDIE